MSTAARNTATRNAAVRNSTAGASTAGASIAGTSVFLYGFAFFFGFTESCGKADGDLFR